MSLSDSIVLPLNATQIFARIASVSFSTVYAVAENVPTVSRTIGMSVAMSRNPSQFIQAAKITKSPSVRAFNALNFS